MADIKIVRTIKPKKGMYIAEGSSEYVGKHPVGEGGNGFWVGFKIVWRGAFFRSESGLLVLPHFCLGVSRISDEKTKSETRWSAFSAGQKSTPIGFGALGGLIAGAVRTVSTKTGGLSGFAVYYNNEVHSTGGFIAAASPDIVEEMLTVIPDEKIIPIPE